MEVIVRINNGEDKEALLLKKKSELHFKTMPKLQAASIFHKGSYNTLATSYESVLKYVEENGYEIVGAIRESYIDGVWNKEDESEWLTEIQVPIRKITSEET